ncbi:MAG: hypothetical protein AB9882_14025 [Ignavibacteriaceae bacterium]
MKTLHALILFIVLFVMSVYSQQKDSGYSIKLGGFIKTDLFYDSHENVSLREGHVLLYPVIDKKDLSGFIYNDKTSFNFLSVQSRINALFSGPEFLGAKASAFVEGEFFGTSELDGNGFRMRHAFLKLDWPSFSILTGQYWHPFLIPDVYADVISFNTGIPFQPFSRNPQVKFVYKTGSFEFAFTLLGQRDFLSPGPVEKSSSLTSSSSFLRNSGLPILDFQVKYKGAHLVAGAGGNFKKLKPRLITEKGFETDQTVSSMAGLAYLKYQIDDFTIKTQGVYGGNMYDFLMIGGYGATSYDTTTGKETYSNINTMSIWTDLSYGKDLKFGLFGGYSLNLGSEDVLLKGKIFSRGEDIHSIYRISGRVTYQMSRVQIGAEIENTVANYGSPDFKGVVMNYKPVSNLRILLSTNFFL